MLLTVYLPEEKKNKKDKIKDIEAVKNKEMMLNANKEIQQ